MGTEAHVILVDPAEGAEAGLERTVSGSGAGRALARQLLEAGVANVDRAAGTSAQGGIMQVRIAVVAALALGACSSSTSGPDGLLPIDASKAATRTARQLPLWWHRLSSLCMHSLERLCHQRSLLSVAER